MAKIGINLNINVKQIEKARLIAGEKGTYLNATVFVDLDNADQYGNNGMITQDVSKEEKEQGTRGNILGNARIFWREEGAPQQPQNQGQQAGGAPPPQVEDFDDDIPF